MFKQEYCQPDLLEMIGTLRSSRGFTGGLNRRQQQGNENPDNSDHYQEFNQSETVPWTLLFLALHDWHYKTIAGGDAPNQFYHSNQV
jgi:hypothetical protein